MDKNRPSELENAKKELAFQMEKKEQCAEELIIANKEIIIQKYEKEKRYHALIENGNDAIVIFNLEGKPTYVSLSIKRVLGYTEEETMQLGIYKVVHPDDREALSNKMAECLDKPGVCLEGHVCRIKHKNGSWKWVEATITNMLHDPAINGIVDNFRDITEKKLAEEKLENSERKFRGLIENGTDGIVILSAEGNPSYVSPSVSRILGYTEQEAMQLNLFALIHPDDRDDTVERMKICLDSPATPLDRIISRVKHKDGSWRWMEATMTNMLHDPAINGIVDNFRDITEKVLAEEKLESNERKFRGLIENGTDGIVILSAEGNPTYVSQSVSRILGYTQQEAMQLNLFAVMHPDDREITAERMKICLNSPAIPMEGIISRVKHKDGSWRWMESTMTNMLHDPAINGIVDNFRDITERKLTEIDLLESREEMQTVFNASLDAIIIIDEEGKITKWDSKSELLFGWKEEEVIGTLLSDNIIPPGLPEAHNLGMKHFLKTGKGPFLNKTIEVKALKKDKTEINISLSISPTRVKNKYQFIGFIRDISERKVVEEALQKSESNLQAIFNNTSDGFILADINGIIKSFNSKARDRTRLNIEKEINIGKSIFDFLPNSRNEMNKDNISKVRSGKILQYDYPYTRKSGKTKWFSFTINPVYNTEKIEGICITSTDITERKIAENKLNATSSELQKALADLSKIMDSSLDVICTIDGDGIFVSVSAASQLIWGYMPDELIGTKFMELVFEEDAEATIKTAEKIISGEPVPIFENRYVHKSGRVVPILWSMNWDDKLKLMFCIAKDVTEKRNLENLLDKSNRLARIGSWEYNIITKTHFWSLITREIFEVKDDITPELQTGITFYKSGASRSSISNAVEKALKDGTPWDLELQIVTVNGNELWVRDIGEAEFINGKCIRLYGSFQDIDARKKAEIETLKAYEEKNIILESIGDAFFAVDKKWTVTYWNKEAEKMLCIPRNKIIDINLWEIFSDRIDSESYKKYHEAIEKNEVINFEDYYGALDKWFEVSAYPSVTGLSVFFKDITDRKLSDLKLSALNLKLTKHVNDLAASNKELEDFAYVASHDLQEPLRMVTGFLGQIEKKYSDIIDDKGKKYIHFAIDGAKRMRQIILDLLEFSRIGRTEDVENNIDLNDIVREVILLCQTQIKETKAIIQFENLPLLLASKSSLRQVFQNLVSNALKYHKKDQPPTISISAEEASTYWQFAIKDNGIGIEEEYFNKIFIIFQRLHNKDEYTGTGIGLAVCKKIIENFGGKIWLASEENKGSTFYFTIPKVLN